MVGIIIRNMKTSIALSGGSRKKYERSGILKEVKKRAYFTKPSVRSA